MLATMVKAPEMVLDDQESKLLAKGLIGVAEQYETAVMSPTTAAWVNLAQTVAMIYAPRVVMIRARAKSTPRQPRQASNPAASPSGPTVGENGLPTTTFDLDAM